MWHILSESWKTRGQAWEGEGESWLCLWHPLVLKCFGLSGLVLTAACQNVSEV